MIWKCYIPGKVGTDWEGGFYPLTLEFSEDYPSKPPKCKFPAGFFHPNGERGGRRFLSSLARASAFLTRAPSKPTTRKRHPLTQPTSAIPRKHPRHRPKNTHHQKHQQITQKKHPPKHTKPTPKVYPSGTVCLSILNEDGGWKPSLTVSQVLSGVQELLDEPNPKSPAQSEAYMALEQRPAEYARLVREQARRHPPPS